MANQAQVVVQTMPHNLRQGTIGTRSFGPLSASLSFKLIRKMSGAKRDQIMRTLQESKRSGAACMVTFIRQDHQARSPHTLIDAYLIR